MLGSHDQEDESHYADLNKTYLTKFQALAKELHVNLVPGTLASRGDDGVLYNIVYWINREGKILGSYTKKNLWHPERPKFGKGSLPHTVFETEFGRTGFLICWDIMFAEAFKQLSDQDVELIVVPSFWLGSDGQPEGGEGEEGSEVHNENSEVAILSTVLTTRAFESNAVVVYVNAAGPVDQGYIAQSQVTLPLVGVKGRIMGPEDDPIVVDVGDNWKKVLKDAEAIYRMKEDRKGPSWHY